MIVTQAGRLQSVTVATNMAGRGVDIHLGGNAEGLARHEVLKEGHDPDVLVDEFDLPMPLDQMPEEFRAARAAAMARYEELVVEFRQECTAEGNKVRALGGLYVIGSERHESRRIDNQLRGRSGRQGDPGESRFYLSLDDELMRLFATGALSYVMNKALPDDEAIEAKMVTKAIERAQNTVEMRNAEIRKNVLKYDEVMNEQRKVIYARRDQILEGEDLKSAAMEYLVGSGRRPARDVLRQPRRRRVGSRRPAHGAEDVLALVGHRRASSTPAATPRRSPGWCSTTPRRTTPSARWSSRPR